MVHPAGRSLWLVAADVPLSRFGPESLEHGLRDLEWVSSIAVAHEAVVEHFTGMRDTAVIPMKLFTIFSSPHRAIAELRRRQKELSAILKRIRGCEEWGVRITRRTGDAVEGRDVRHARSSGAAFLMAKKHARDRARESGVQAARAAGEALNRLAALARGVRRREPPDGVVSPPLVDAALLVPIARRSRFRASVGRVAEECRRAGAEIALTGPWPAYHFIQPPEDA
jgi:hypothetical protein